MPHVSTNCVTSDNRNEDTLLPTQAFWFEAQHHFWALICVDMRDDLALLKRMIDVRLLRTPTRGVGQPFCAMQGSPLF